MILEKTFLICTTTILGGLTASAIQPDSVSTTFIGVCATILLWVVKELNGLSSRIAKLEQKVDDKLDGIEP